MKALLTVLCLFGLLPCRAQTQLINGGFESWHFTPGNYEEPDYTQVYDPVQGPVTKTTDAYSGQYAARFTTGTRCAYADMKQPISRRPDYCAFWYKYDPKGMDTVSVIINIRHTGYVIGYGAIHFSAAANSYQQAFMPITYYIENEEADDIVVMLNSCGYHPDAGTTFWVDDLQLHYSSAIGELPGKESERSYAVFPNPAGNTVRIVKLMGSSNASILMKDVLGRTLLADHATISNVPYTVNTASYPAGTYFLKIEADGGAAVTERLVIAH